MQYAHNRDKYLMFDKTIRIDMIKKNIDKRQNDIDMAYYELFFLKE